MTGRLQGIPCVQKVPSENNKLYKSASTLFLTTEHLQNSYFFIYMLSEKVSSRFKASETHKGAKHAIKLHMVLKPEYRKHLQKISPGGRRLLALYPTPTPCSQASFYLHFVNRKIRLVEGQKQKAERPERTWLRSQICHPQVYPFVSLSPCFTPLPKLPHDRLLQSTLLDAPNTTT